MPKKINIEPTKNGTNKSEKELSEKKIISTIQNLFPGKINFSISETASILNISYDFVRKNILNGRIKSTRFGDRCMVNIYELNRLLLEGVE
jgi:excisionase family DNA binding protein